MQKRDLGKAGSYSFCAPSGGLYYYAHSLVWKTLPFGACMCRASATSIWDADNYLMWSSMEACTVAMLEELWKLTSSGVLLTDEATLSLNVPYMSSSRADSCSLWGSDMSFLESWSPALLYFPNRFTWGSMPAFSKTPATKLPAEMLACLKQGSYGFYKHQFSLPDGLAIYWASKGDSSLMRVWSLTVELFSNKNSAIKNCNSLHIIAQYFKLEMSLPETAKPRSANDAEGAA